MLTENECIELLGFDFRVVLQNKIKVLRQRKGQAVSNTAYVFFIYETRELSGSKYDCFHKDENVVPFLNRLLEMITK